MAKKDEIILIIAKSFSRQNLTKEEVNICKDMSSLELVTEFGLNTDQAAEVLKWCTLNCAAESHDVFSLLSEEEKEEYISNIESNLNMLQENIFRRIKDTFKKKKKYDFELEIKKQIEMCASDSSDFSAERSNVKRFKDKTQVGEFLQKANSFKNEIQKTGTVRSIKNNERLDQTTAKTKRLSIKDVELSKDYPESFAKNLVSIFDKIEMLELALTSVIKSLPSSAKNEALNVFSRQIKTAEILSSGYMNLKEFNRAKRSLEKFIDFMYEEIKLKTKQQKYLLAVHLKKYIGNLYYELFQIIEADSKTTTNTDNSSDM